VRFPITLDKQNRQTVARATDLRFSLQNSFTVCGGPKTYEHVLTGCKATEK
jgi:hypothetical protein